MRHNIRSYTTAEDGSEERRVLEEAPVVFSRVTYYYFYATMENTATGGEVIQTCAPVVIIVVLLVGAKPICQNRNTCACVRGCQTDWQHPFSLFRRPETLLLPGRTESYSYFYFYFYFGVVVSFFILFLFFLHSISFICPVGSSYIIVLCTRCRYS